MVRASDSDTPMSRRAPSRVTICRVSRRLTVIPCDRVPRKGRSRLWAYGYADLAALLGTTEGAARQAVARGTLNPKDLRAVCEAWQAREARATRAR